MLQNPFVKTGKMSKIILFKLWRHLFAKRGCLLRKCIKQILLQILMRVARWICWDQFRPLQTPCPGFLHSFPLFPLRFFLFLYSWGVHTTQRKQIYALDEKPQRKYLSKLGTLEYECPQLWHSALGAKLPPALSCWVVRCQAPHHLMLPLASRDVWHNSTPKNLFCSFGFFRRGSIFFSLQFSRQVLSFKVSPLTLGQTSKNKFWPRRLDVLPTWNYFCLSAQDKLKSTDDNFFCLNASTGATIIQPEFWNALVRHVSLQCFCLRSNWCPVPPAQTWTRSSPNWTFGDGFDHWPWWSNM